MAVVFSDSDIASLIHEPKVVPVRGWRRASRLTPKGAHGQGRLEARGVSGVRFVIIVRANAINSLDFSVILGTYPNRSNQLFRLRRYNGKGHPHRNKIEGNAFYDFHIHTATERYQSSGYDEDGYAETTDRFATYVEAMHCLFEDTHCREG